MIRRRAPHIPIKEQIYVGCEGKSEVAYATLLRDFAIDADRPVYLKIDELAPGAGDPLARVEMAVRRIDQQRKRRIAPAASFLFVDEDQTAREPQRAEKARRMAANKGIAIIWQRPCFEAMLLRHLPGRAGHRQPDTQRACLALEGEWPGYAKPMARAALARRIDLAALLGAAAVEPELAALLRRIGLV